VPYTLNAHGAGRNSICGTIFTLLRRHPAGNVLATRRTLSASTQPQAVTAARLVFRGQTFSPLAMTPKYEGAAICWSRRIPELRRQHGGQQTASGVCCCRPGWKPRVAPWTTASTSYRVTLAVQRAFQGVNIMVVRITPNGQERGKPARQTRGLPKAAFHRRVALGRNEADRASPSGEGRVVAVATSPYRRRPYVVNGDRSQLRVAGPIH